MEADRVRMLTAVVGRKEEASCSGFGGGGF